MSKGIIHGNTFIPTEAIMGVIEGNGEYGWSPIMTKTPVAKISGLGKVQPDRFLFIMQKMGINLFMALETLQGLTGYQEPQEPDMLFLFKLKNHLKTIVRV